MKITKQSESKVHREIVWLREKWNESKIRDFRNGRGKSWSTNYKVINSHTKIVPNRLRDWPWHVLSRGHRDSLIYTDLHFPHT